jgi:vesicle-fusing ATPase
MDAIRSQLFGRKIVGEDAKSKQTATKDQSAMKSPPIAMKSPSPPSPKAMVSNCLQVVLCEKDRANELVVQNACFVTPVRFKSLHDGDKNAEIYLQLSHPKKTKNITVTRILTTNHIVNNESEVEFDIDSTIVILPKSHRDAMSTDNLDVINYKVIHKANLPRIGKLFVKVTEFPGRKPNAKNPEKQISQDDLEQALKNLAGTTVHEDRYIFIKTEQGLWQIDIAVIEFEGQDDSCSSSSDSGSNKWGLLTEEMEIIPTGQVKLSKFFKFDDMSFSKLGVGGLGPAFKELCRRVFMTRIIKKNVYEKMGLKHIKGILLYGPPGTGKTQLARSLGNLLNCASIQIVNGPEILNKFVGASEENIRKLFEPAEKNPEGVHLIIFDEFEAICKSRGSASSGLGNDSVVNQLLSKIDGVNAINNIILIGMTNRKDMIDKAILRQGRFEVHIEIGLPDLEGRKQIFSIHTQKLRDNGFIDATVNFDRLSEMTENMTGAEIESIVKEASSYALADVVDINNIEKTAKDADKMMITQEDFDLAVTNMKPMFGNDKEKINQLTNDEMLTFNNVKYQQLVSQTQQVIQNFKANKRHFKTILLHGLSGSGKSYLGAHLAKSSQFKFTKYLSAYDVVRCNESEKRNRLLELIDDAKKSEESLVVIDDIDIMIEWTPPNILSNQIVQTLKTILSLSMTTTKLCLILITNQYEDLKSKLIFDKIDDKFELPLIEGQTIKQIINEPREQSNEADLEV